MSNFISLRFSWTVRRVYLLQDVVVNDQVSSVRQCNRLVLLVGAHKQDDRLLAVVVRELAGASHRLVSFARVHAESSEVSPANRRRKRG